MSYDFGQCKPMEDDDYSSDSLSTSSPCEFGCESREYHEKLFSCPESLLSPEGLMLKRAHEVGMYGVSSSGFGRAPSGHLMALHHERLSEICPGFDSYSAFTGEVCVINQDGNPEYENDQWVSLQNQRFDRKNGIRPSGPRMELSRFSALGAVDGRASVYVVDN